MGKLSRMGRRLRMMQLSMLRHIGTKIDNRSVDDRSVLDQLHELKSASHELKSALHNRDDLGVVLQHIVEMKGPIISQHKQLELGPVILERIASMKTEILDQCKNRTIREQWQANRGNSSKSLRS
eukprot:gnl/TRDRNA2_/TRDRNA2_155463_c0_seq1.p1 gnl/TRDRNA2_/TRDRNA2_155463_c0~~gnl/TRDRNA2_/TRDRNA2_155463_c0_seq1.p1  ORF type:complete len:125 (-),score=19.45 gnl/TRDRNA2_/TRDRNA2_155463_c0_seq1:217-591(-)